MTNRFLCAALLTMSLSAQAQKAEMVAPSDVKATSELYVNNRAPLRPNVFLRLAPGAVKPKGWVAEMIKRQANGLAGHLGEISDWLDRKNNAWLEQGGDHGWEEVPYWLRGYSQMAYILQDEKMLEESMFWIESILKSAQPDGYFGPINADSNGRRELWANMLALQILQNYYEYSQDERVLKLMTDYCRWELNYPDEKFLRAYWENSRGGDNMLSVIWLYNRTGDAFLLDLIEKIHRCTANWMMESSLPNWHNVNVAECFREPAQYYLLTGKKEHLQATYNNHNLIRHIYGQVPGGMFGADENARHGYIDPRQGTETCGFVEQMYSDEILMAQTGDVFWAENLEDVAYNSLPAAMTADMRALRYLTCPNMVQSDSRNHHPGVDNSGPFFAMNPFSSRCCQHNHAMGWPYYAQNLVLASADGGAAFLTYAACEATLQVADGQTVSFTETTRYPFSEDVDITISGLKKKSEVEFPLYFRIPEWADGTHVTVNGKTVDGMVQKGLLRITNAWKNGDRISLYFPMRLTQRTWAFNGNSISVNYGPLTLSLLIKERYDQKDSRATAIGDSHWQENADASQWPTFEIYADSPWNYALVSRLHQMEVERLEWPADDYPFTPESVPLRVKARGARIPSWGMDESGLCQILPPITAPRERPEDITLIPMGAARLRISAFPPYRRQ